MDGMYTKIKKKYRLCVTVSHNTKFYIFNVIPFMYTASSGLCWDHLQVQ